MVTRRITLAALLLALLVAACGEDHRATGSGAAGRSCAAAGDIEGEPKSRPPAWYVERTRWT
jgi:hypothetical protein